MTSFVNAIQNQVTTTTNDMPAYVNTSSACVDLFYKAGAMRGQDIIPDFVAAYVENADMALRIAQWLRDIRSGAGERELFRNILRYLEEHDSENCIKLLYKIPEIGRFDDLFAVKTKRIRNIAFSILKNALDDYDGLAFKYCPREKSANKQDYIDFRNYLGMTPKEYRLFIVEGSNTTEQLMCAKKFNEINFSHVPSICHARNKKAFIRNAKEEYNQYIANLKTGEAKINAGAIYPYEVIKGRCDIYWDEHENVEELETVIEEQWKSLPNYVGDHAILPVVDVSDSMQVNVASNVTALEVAVSLGLYLSDKNTGVFKDAFLTFSESPTLKYLKGTIGQKIDQMIISNWGFNTNIEKAFDLILDVAVQGKVSKDEMPKYLLILSDMQFDVAVENNYAGDNCITLLRKKYQEAGYDMPKVVFWNLYAHDNVPVKHDESGTCLVSGFSPTILKSILGDVDSMTPYNMMVKTVMIDRYSLL